MWVVSTFFLIYAMPISLSKILISFSFCDWFKRNADWRVQETVVAREQKYKMGNPAWIICKMSWSCCSIFFLRRLYYFLGTCIFSGRFNIFKALQHFQSALTFSKRFNIFKALYQSALSKRFIKALLLFFKALLQSAFIIFQSTFIQFF